MNLNSARAAPSPLYGRLFDDAAIFPPGNAPMSLALADHTKHRNAWYGTTIGPFVCSDGRWPELSGALPNNDANPLDLALVVTAGLAAVDKAVAAALDDPRVTLRAVEVRGDSDGVADAVRLLDGVPGDVLAYLELPLRSGPAIGLAALHGSPHRAKFRTGGPAPEAGLLAETLLEAARWDVPFKLTAGLHHAVSRHTHHGFLNILLAASLALEGPPVEAIAGMLADERDEAVAERIRELSAEQQGRVRRLFVSFGTCSIGDPLADLLALGLVS